MRDAAKRAVRAAAKKAGVYWPHRDRTMVRKWQEQIRSWRDRGCPPPAPHPIKVDILRRYVEEYGLRTMVETGTYIGDMTALMRPHLDRIVTIELGPELWADVVDRFRADPAIDPRLGDSGELMAELVPTLDDPVLFWLDAHYSAGNTARGTVDTPILVELETILASPVPGHVILIDDARDFGVDPAYPTLDELEAFVRERRPELEMAVDVDIIRIKPPKRP